MPGLAGAALRQALNPLQRRQTRSPNPPLQNLTRHRRQLRSQGVSFRVRVGGCISVTSCFISGPHLAWHDAESGRKARLLSGADAQVFGSGSRGGLAGAFVAVAVSGFASDFALSSAAAVVVRSLKDMSLSYA